MMLAWLCKIVWAVRRRPNLLAQYALEVPPREELEEGQIVVVGPKGQPKWISMRCPCGCGVPFLLSLSAARRPRWKVSCDWLSRPSIEPSINRLDGCRSHFWVRRGHVHWCEDSGAIDSEEKIST
jgi:hypothetical protein